MTGTKVRRFDNYGTILKIKIKRIKLKGQYDQLSRLCIISRKRKLLTLSYSIYLKNSNLKNWGFFFLLSRSILDFISVTFWFRIFHCSFKLRSSHSCNSCIIDNSPNKHYFSAVIYSPSKILWLVRNLGLKYKLIAVYDIKDCSMVLQRSNFLFLL